MRPLTSPSRFSNSAISAGRFLVLGFGLLLAVGSAASADPIVYTEMSTASGSLGSSTFTDATVTLTVVADTANIYTTVISGINAYENAGTVTVTISGVGSATLMGDTFGAIAQDISQFVPNTGTAGIVDLSTEVGLLGNIYSVPPPYYLTGPITLTGTGEKGIPATFQTTSGDLSFTSVSGDGTFTATPSSVPEPASAVSCLLGLIACVTATRHRRRQPVNA